MALLPSVERQQDAINELRLSIQRCNSATRQEQQMLLENCANDEQCITTLYLWLVAEASVDPRDVIPCIKLKAGQPRHGAISAAKKRHEQIGLLVASAR